MSTASEGSDFTAPALVVGATGIVGQNLAVRLIEQGRPTYGLSRSGGVPDARIRSVAADLSDPVALATAL
jgi:uncharacterized protein YbjT (DUF2867 family)